jgi:hypothetical protein
MGAAAELVRYDAIRGKARADEYRRDLWYVYVEEHDIADLSAQVVPATTTPQTTVEAPSC